jgi:ABC-2 type transport system permease protein
MRSLTLLARQIGYEQRAFWRNASAAVFTFVFPLLMLVIFGTINQDARIRALGGISYNQYFVPGIVAFGVISACYTKLAMTLSILRDAGVLKRLRGTPLPPWLYMAGQIGSSLVVSLLLVALTTALGITAYGVVFPGHYAALALALVAGAFCFCALGIALTAAIPSATAAPAIVNGLLFPILFISGTFYPLAPDSWLARVAEVFPIRHFEEALFRAFDPAAAGNAIAPKALVVMLLWGAGALAIALRSFRWEPRPR